MHKGIFGTDIVKKIKNDKIAKKTFLGVYPRDLLPEMKQRPASIIINTDPSYLPGRHWLAFYIDKNGVGFFFDSYGKSPAFYGLEHYLKKLTTTIVTNNQRLQGVNSSTCGLFSIYFILLKSRGFSMNQIVQIFSKKHFSFNDELIKNLIDGC